jgi:hypothetical protein
VEEDRRHEDDGGVEVEHRGDRCLDEQQRREQRERAAGRAGGERARLREDALPRGGRADEQQSGDESEGRPCLSKRRLDVYADIGK